MDASQILTIGTVTAINLIVIKVKYEHHRHSDATVDAILLVLLAMVFGRTIAGLQIATVSSLIISIYLYFSPPTKLVNKLKELKDQWTW